MDSRLILYNRRILLISYYTKVLRYGCLFVEYIKDCTKQYDSIIVDLPAPNSEVLNKLYSNIFYRMCGACLRPENVAGLFLFGKDMYDRIFCILAKLG